MDESALQKLQSLVRMVALRRPRTVVSLPDRSESVHYILFSEAESQLYNQAKAGDV